MRWERIDNVRREMVERGMSSLIVSDPMSIYYLSDVYISRASVCWRCLLSRMRLSCT